jgi:hypothetical protein
LDTKEIDRVTGNPDNLIMSDELEAILSEDKSLYKTGTEDCVLTSGDEDHLASLIKIIKENSTYKFVLSVPTLSIGDVFEERTYSLTVDGYEFCQSHPTVVWEDSRLIFTARRIIK